MITYTKDYFIVKRQQANLSLEILNVIEKHSGSLNNIQVLEVLTEYVYRYLCKKSIEGLINK